MNNQVQHELATALAELRKLYPEWRYGQMITNVASWAGKDQPLEVWDVDDEQLLRAAREHLAAKGYQVAKSA